MTLSTRQGGFTYVMVLAAVVIVGIVAEAARVTTWRILKADREAELLFRGRAYQRAIESFHKTNGSFPRSLEDLLKDPRAAARRHIRTLYTDPMTKDEQQGWLLIRATDRGIRGVTSTSAEEPLKQANFPKEYAKFSGAVSYKDWIFEYVLQSPQPVRPAVPTLSPAAQPPVLRTH